MATYGCGSTVLSSAVPEFVGSLLPVFSDWSRDPAKSLGSLDGVCVSAMEAGVCFRELIEEDFMAKDVPAATSVAAVQRYLFQSMFFGLLLLILVFLLFLCCFLFFFFLSLCVF